MKNDVKLKEITILLKNQLKDCKNGYNSLKNEYWFGRLSVIEEIYKQIYNIISEQ